MKKVEELDAARVWSMLAVIAIHVTAPYIGADSDFLLGGMNLAYIINQAARFAVPLFVLLSGASLGLGKAQPAGQFYRRRVVKLGIPYVCWTMVYTLWAHQSLAPGALVRRFLLGQAAPFPASPCRAFTLSYSPREGESTSFPGRGSFPPRRGRAADGF